MNLKRFINIILLIIIIHFVLRNLRMFSFNITLPYSSFQSQPAKTNKSLDFLTSIEPFHNNADSPFGKLTTDVAKCVSPATSIKAGNYYLSNDNEVNFKPNVMNINKFYDIKTQNDTIPEKPERGKVNEPTVAEVKDNTCFSVPNTGKQTYQEDQWNYKNELPMNGGFILPGLMGYNSGEEAFATYGSSALSNVSCDGKDSIVCELQPDDIRMGLGYPNAEYRATR